MLWNKTNRHQHSNRADAFRINAIFDSEDTSSDASIPTINLTSIQGTFVRETINNGTTGTRLIELLILLHQ